LKRFGIDSEKVHYICFGVGYGNSGVKKDFTIFSGDELLEKCQIYMINTSVGIPDSEEPNVNGFLSGMTLGKYL
jgi:hypothetical protein